MVAVGGRAGLLRAVSQSPPRERRWWRSPLARVSHPPDAARRALAGRDGAGGLALLLALWPAMPLVLLAVVLSSAVPGWRLLGYSWSRTWRLAGTNSAHFLADAAPLWVAALALLLAWPVAAAWWTRLCTRLPATAPGLPAAAYPAAALLPAALVALTLVTNAAG